MCDYGVSYFTYFKNKIIMFIEILKDYKHREIIVKLHIVRAQ